MASSIQQLKDQLSRINSPSSSQWIGFRKVRTTEEVRSARDENPLQNVVSPPNEGIMVEVLSKKGQFAYVCTPDVSDRGVQEATDLAASLAERASEYKVIAFTPEVRPPNEGYYESSFKKGILSYSAKEINELLIETTKKLKIASTIIHSHAEIEIKEINSQYVSSNGAAVEQHTLLSSLGFGAMAEKDGVVQNRTDGGFMAQSFQAGLELLGSNEYWNRVKRVASEAIELLDAEDCPTGVMDLVLTPDQMMLQIHESVGHPLELDRILGDERNYAGSSFVKPSDFGTLQYGSNLMNITFDPELRGEFASYGFDDSGAKATREFLIKEGVLVRGLGGLESQLRSRLPGVSTFRAPSWNRAPIDRISNVNLEPGESSFDEIISCIERGVLMRSNRSWSIDDYRRKFQFGCEYGKLIENGKITKTLKNPNYRGISTEFWNSLKKVGDRSTFEIYGTPYCGKGEPSQTVHVGHASPVCLFEGIEIFGGHS